MMEDCGDGEVVWHMACYHGNGVPQRPAEHKLIPVFFLTV